MGWVISHVSGAEEALHQAFVENEGTAGKQLLAREGETDNSFYKKWTKSRISKDIDQALSGEGASRIEMLADDSEPESGLGAKVQHTASIATANSAVSGLPKEAAEPAIHPGQYPKSRCIMYPRLPLQWRRLVDIYFSYTHCWLPIVRREEVYSAAMLYAQDGLQVSRQSDPHALACHTQLWTVLALASFQDAHSSLQEDSAKSAEGLYKLASSFIPEIDSCDERPMVCTLLLQTLILIGKGETTTAWVMAGRATRLALSSECNIRETRALDTAAFTSSPVLAACYVLDTFLSICLRKPALLAAPLDLINNSANFPLSGEMPEDWRPIAGLGSVAGSQPTAGYPALTLYQLLEFSFRVSEAALSGNEMHGDKQLRGYSDNLIDCLHPEFQFCNSLNVLGTSTPALPSASLLQVAFLTSSILVSGYRASLLFTMLEIIELGIDSFGECGTSPIVACFMESLAKHVDFDDMRPSDRTKWFLLLGRIRSPWHSHDSPRRRGSNTSLQPRRESHRPSHETASQETTSQRSRPSPDTPSGHMYQSLSVSSGHPPPLPTPSVGLDASPADNFTLQGPEAAYHPIDYEALLGDLGAIDYANTADLDPQFMANLGFTPRGQTPGSAGGSGHL